MSGTPIPPRTRAAHRRVPPVPTTPTPDACRTCINSTCPLFNSDEVCLRHLWKVQYGDLQTCPKCRRPATFHRCRNRRAWACARCASPISPAAHTIFHKSSTPLSHWFYAIAEMSSRTEGITPRELQQTLGCTYKTAWRMCKKIREFFSSGDYNRFFTDPARPYRSLLGVPRVCNRQLCPRRAPLRHGCG